MPRLKGGPGCPPRNMGPALRSGPKPLLGPIIVGRILPGPLPGNGGLPGMPPWKLPKFPGGGGPPGKPIGPGKCPFGPTPGDIGGGVGGLGPGSCMTPPRPGPLAAILHANGNMSSFNTCARRLHSVSVLAWCTTSTGSHRLPYLPKSTQRSRCPSELTRKY
jgi:hypothetical protein